MTTNYGSADAHRDIESAYEPPRIEPLGSLADITLGASGTTDDGLGSAQFGSGIP